MTANTSRKTLAIALSSLALFSCGDTASTRARSGPKLVLLVVVDALRADHLGCYGYSRPTSPAIDAFASNATRFTRAFAASSWTKPAMPSVLTGLPPSRHGVLEGSTTLDDGRTVSDVLAPEARTLAEALADTGYSNGAFLKNAQLAPGSGFEQGFHVYEEGVGDAKAIHDRFLKWLDAERAKSKDSRLFAWLHVLDVHWPYLPPPDAANRFPLPDDHRDLSADAQGLLRDQVNDGLVALTPEDRRAIETLYDACIAGYDARFAELLAALRTRGEFDDALIVLTSDHGEEFGEAGKLGHGHSLSEALLHIPLLVKQPGQREGAREEIIASHLDLFPTIAAMTGSILPRSLPGNDLFASPRDPSAISEILHGARHDRSLRVEDWRYGESFLFRGLASHSEETVSVPGPAVLRPGLRVDAKCEVDGTEIEVEQISLEDGADDDIEIRGPIESIDPTKGVLRVGPFTVDVEPKILVRVRGGTPISLADLRTGDVIDIDGEATAPARIAADALESRPDKRGSDTLKIEGVIELVDVDDAEFVLGRMRLKLDAKTKYVGFDGERRIARSRVPRGLLHGPALDDATIFEQVSGLWSVSDGVLSADDRSASHPRVRDGLARRIRALLDGCPRFESSENALDDETMRQLRAIGYIR